MRSVARFTLRHIAAVSVAVTIPVCVFLFITDRSGLIPIAIVVAPALYYTITTAVGSTEPASWSWLIWAMVDFLGYSVLKREESGAEAFLYAVYSANFVIIFLLSLRNGKPDHDRYDPFLGAAALLGIIGWYLIDLPPNVASTIAGVLGSIGAIYTIRGAWRQPESEPTWTWIMGTGAASAALIILGSKHSDYATLFYPSTIVFNNLVIVGALLLRMTHRFRLPDTRSFAPIWETSRSPES